MLMEWSVVLWGFSSCFLWFNTLTNYTTNWIWSKWPPVSFIEEDSYLHSSCQLEAKGRIGTCQSNGEWSQVSWFNENTSPRTSRSYCRYDFTFLTRPDKCLTHIYFIRTCHTPHLILWGLHKAKSRGSPLSFVLPHSNSLHTWHKIWYHFCYCLWSIRGWYSCYHPF